MSFDSRHQLRQARRNRYKELIEQCQAMHGSVGSGKLAYTVGSKVMDARVKSRRFLGECKESGDRAYATFRAVLERLQSGDEQRRAQARLLLAAVQRYVDLELPNVDCLSTFHFRIHQLVLSDLEGLGTRTRQKLTLLELPSIFIPEDWSFTFFEGINRLPESGFHDRDVAELGCGNGWVSIAIAEKWFPKKVYGLDINPRAIKVAWINLYLNALSPEDGSLVRDREGKSLLDRVEFHVSDLLACIRDRNLLLDRIVGCIPQVLNPDPQAMLKMVSENASEEFLYSLSNYCGLQGFVEDQFGLGLIARAAEEAIDVIKPSGTMVFNIGGRPGQAVCERLFQRRGFTVSKLWQTRVKQAADTDILALVEIEKNSRHRFEFFMGLQSEEPISARTAWAYSKAGGEISHALSVYQCRLRHPNEIKTIFKFLSDKSQEIRGALDLSFHDDSVAEEKIPFLAYLASALEARSYLPHELSAKFPNLVADFLKIYHGIPLVPQNVLVQSSRSVLIENVLRLYQPQLALIDASFTRWMPKKWLTVLPQEACFVRRQDANEISHSVAVVEAPRRADLVIELIRHLRPQIVVTSLADFEMQTSTAFEQLLQESDEAGARIFIDISDHVELSSAPRTNGVLQYLAVHALPVHAAIICGLVKNKVYSDLEVAFLLSEDKDTLEAVALAGEMLHGRTALMSQFYYGCLLHELLSFHLPDRHPARQRLVKAGEPSRFIGLAGCTRQAMLGAELPSSPFPGSDVLRLHMDLDDNSLPTSPAVKVVMFEAFARQNISEAERDPRPEILALIQSKFGLDSDSCSELVLGDSCLSLFSSLVAACVEEQGTLCFPTGCNGTYLASARLLGASVRCIPTRKEDGFKLTVQGVEDFIKDVDKPWLYMSGPTVNPTGMLFSSQEIASILSVCNKAGARVVLDTSFSGLEYGTARACWDLKGLVSGSNNMFAVVLLGGFSIQLLTGGHEIGFATHNSPVFGEAFKDAASRSRPHYTSNYVVKKLLAMLNSQSEVMLGGLTQQRSLLKHRVCKMKEALLSCGWEPVEPQAGISMVARPSAYIGKSVCIGQNELVTLTYENLREVLMRTTGLCISSSSWTGLAGYCRFVIAQDDDKFQAAVDALLKFKEYAR